MYERRSYRYPPLEPLTPEEDREVDKIILGKSKDAAKVRELRSQRRKARWQERLRMLPFEILTASDASYGEIDFLLGRSSIDPTPQREITYKEIEPGDEVIVFGDPNNEQIDLSKGFFHLKASQDDDVKDRRLDRLGIYVGSQKREADLQASVTKQAVFHTKARMAFAKAIEASDGMWDEFDFLNDIRDYDGKKLSDPNPDHIITYRRLVAKAEQTENSITTV